MRTFTDQTGREWQAWKTVPPPGTERRRGERRTGRGGYAGPERRVQDRRTGADRRGNASAEGERPWLCFESEGEMRRCGYVPADWEHFGEPELRVLLRAALPRLRASRPPSEPKAPDGQSTAGADQ